MDVVFKIGNSVPPEQFGEYRIVDEFCIHPIFQQPHHRHYLELEFEEGRFRMSSSKLAIFRIPNPVTFSQIYFATIQYTVFTGTVCREFHLFLGLKTLPEPLTKRRKQIFVNYAVIAVCTMMHYAVCTLMHYAVCTLMHYAVYTLMHYAVCTLMHYAVCTLMHYALCNMHSDALCSMHYMQW